MKTCVTLPRSRSYNVLRKARVRSRRAARLEGAASASALSSRGIREILVPIDFSEPSKKALKYAVAFATQFGAQLILLHVIEPTAQGFPYPALALENDQVKATMKRRLEGLCKYETTNPRLIQKAAVTHGRAFQEVVRAARGLQVDLIIMATHGHTGIKHVLLGSTTERVVRYAPCPVLVVREKEESLKVPIQTPRMRHD